MMFPASIPLYLLSRESKSAATVMLAGEGADEILAGYGNNVRAYWTNRLTSRLPPAVRRSLAGLSLPGRVRAVAARAALGETALIMNNFMIGGSESLTRACRIPLPAAVDDDAAVLAEVGLADRRGTFLDRLLYFQLKTYLVGLLMKQDKMSMAASIETRVPFLDHHLVASAFSMPDDRKIKGRSGKHLLKQASRGLVPDAVIDRPKRGFPVPIAHWLRQGQNPFVDILLDPETLRDGWLDAEFVRGRVARFRAGEEVPIELWAMINLELWRREFMSGVRAVRAMAS
jgi:asparagine synthase (glutamine-hydrolysing)